MPGESGERFAHTYIYGWRQDRGGLHNFLTKEERASQSPGGKDMVSTSIYNSHSFFHQVKLGKESQSP